MGIGEYNEIFDVLNDKNFLAFTPFSKLILLTMSQNKSSNRVILYNYLSNSVADRIYSFST